jgi:Caspase domain
MGADDWALVVGIANYPSYGHTPDDANNLRGPIYDAEAVAKFLKNEYHVGHITLLTSTDNNGAPWSNQPRPIRADIESWIRDVAVQSARNIASGNGPQVGRRLYIYMSGHGLAPEYYKRALVTSNALSKVFVDHVLATTWQEHLPGTRFFSEYVLWMDCCTQARVTLVPSLPPFEIKAPPVPRPPQVVICAAKFPLLAVELPLGPNGEFCGLFTHELLRGLRGAAVNPTNGGIRTKDLRAHLFKTMPPYIDALPDKTGLSREPDFLADDDIEFTSPQQTPAAPTQRLIEILASNGAAPADGTPINVLDHNRAAVATVLVAARQITLPLPPGLYKLEWPGGRRLIEIADESVVHA